MLPVGEPGVAAVPELTVLPSDPESAEARSAIARFFADIVGRRLGRRATAGEVAAVMRDEPSADLHGDTGFFVLVLDGERTVACGGVRLIDAETGELRRIFVDPGSRGRGVSRMLLREVEAMARDRGVRRLRLTVRDDLAEARGLYAREGYLPTAPFSDAPYADHFLRKDLAAGGD